MDEVKSGEGYIEAGSGLPIVMLPGMEGSREFWRYQVEALAPSSRAVACDLAVRKPSLSSTVEDYAAHTLQIMDSLGIDKAVMVGESMGGMVTQHIATRYPERVLGVVLCNTMDRPRRGGFGLNMFTLATLVHNLAFLPFLSDNQRRKILRWVGKHRGFVMDPTPGNDGLIDYLFAHGMECGGPAYLDKVIACGKGRYTEVLSSINVPALVLRGTEDRLVGPATACELAGRIPDAELVLIEGGGHCCTHTVPEESTDAIRAWLTRHGLV
jgi:pimeloyl-ACP methyl ester carboxylesterase